MKRLNETVRIILIMVSLLAGCESKPPQTGGEKPHSQPVITAGTPEEIVRKTVERYNQLIIEGYTNLNMTQLQEVATEEVALQAYYHMSAIGEGKAKMLSRVKNIDFVKTEFPAPGKCRLQTKEVWDFSYHDIAGGNVLQEVKDYVYHVQYTIENRQGRWTITGVSARGEEGGKKGPSWEQFFGRGSGDRGKQ